METQITLAGDRSLSLVPEESLLNRFLAYVDTPSAETVRTYTTALQLFFLWLSDNGITHPQREDIQAYKNWLRDAPIEAGPRKGRARKPATIQNYLSVIKVFFQWTEQERIYPDIARHIKAPRSTRKHKKEPFTDVQVRIILDTMPRETLGEKRDYAIMLLLFTGGLRTVEISRLKLRDMKSADGHYIVSITGKGYEEESRDINLTPQTEAALWAYLRARGPADREEPLFISLSNNSKGKPYSSQSVSKMAKRTFIAAGFDEEVWTAHSTRHTAISLGLEDKENNDLTDAQDFAGHASPETTMIYVHKSKRTKSHFELSIEKAIFGQKGNL